MYVFPPKLQDLSTWPSRNSTRNTRGIWEISAPPDQSFYWSLFLSFVIASPENSDWLERLLGNEKEIKELMQKKNIRDQMPVSKTIKKEAMNFNPFKNQHSFYHNKKFKNVLRMFSLRLKRAAYEMKKNSGGLEDDMKLMAATKMLKCCIEVYETNSEENKLQPQIHAPVVGRVVLVLFKHSGVCKKYKTESPPGQTSDHKVINVYGFGMSLDHVIPLRRDALGHILKRTDISHQLIRDVQQDFTGSGNFLVSLLVKESQRETVPSIFTSPYIAWKLAAAGFVTDPCSLDGNQLSAFYHCMGLDSTLLLYVLYDYASNSFEHSDNTTRKPDMEILSALKKIEKSLQKDRLQSNGFSVLGDKKAIAIKSFEEVLCFNEYQRSVIEEIVNLQGNSSPQVSQTDDEIRNLIRRKQIIDSLLKFYPKYFNYPNENQTKDTVVVKNKYCKFEDFIQRSEYYENLDNYTCLLFFDNFLFLDLPSDIMNSVVQHLFLTVFSYKLFKKCPHGVHCTKHILTTEDCAIRVIPFIFRSNFLEIAKVVQAELKRPSTDDVEKFQKHQSKKEKGPNSVMMQVTSGLKNFPEIKDEFLIGRLRYYLDIATNVAIDDEDVKGVLVMERALQVIGETLNTSESSSVIGHLLCSCLSENAVEEFFRIRNHCLSHYRPRLMGGKLNLECESRRFKDIQNVIREVNCMFQPVYVSQLLRIIDYLVESGLHESKDIDKTLWKNMEKKHNVIRRSLLDKYIKNKGRYSILTNNLLNYVEEKAREKKCHKFQKSGHISALKFLFAFLASQCEEKKSEIFHILQELNKMSKYFESRANETKRNEIEISTSESQDITKIVTDLRNITDFIFSEVKGGSAKMVDHSIIKTFFSDARSFSWLTVEEMSTLKVKISEHFLLSREAKASLEKVLLAVMQKKIQLSEEEAQELLIAIFATKKDKSCILKNLSSNPELALKTLRSIRKDEQDIFQKNSDREDDTDCLIKFSETEEGNNLLLNMEFPDDYDNKLHLKVLHFLNRKVEFLLNRIGHLKSILIDEDDEILSLWNWGKSEAIKTHTKYLMCQRYRREKDVRAALEMLLFDCMNILKSKSSLSRLWSKANDLFSGSNLRDILSHGSTILEIVGVYLDKNDLPSHFIDKTLELIEDGDALKTLSELWETTKITDRKHFEDLLDADDPSLREVQKWMKKRSGSMGGWRDYLTLLPLK